MLLSTLSLRRPIPDREAMLAGWELALADVPYEAARLAAAWWMAHETYLPEPALLRRRALGSLARLPGPYAAWDAVLRDLSYRNRHHEWPDEEEARRYREQHGEWPPETETVIDRAVAVIGGWERLKGHEWERKEFLRAYQEFAGEALDATGAAVSGRTPVAAIGGA